MSSNVDVRIPVSVGELADKVTILRLKSERIKDPVKLKNVETELLLLVPLLAQIAVEHPELSVLTDELAVVNGKLWSIEDGKRDCERSKRFDQSFIELARAVYIENDNRAEIKRRINAVTGSRIVEEKSYERY